MLYLGIFLFITICLIVIPLKISIVVNFDDKLLDFSFKLYILCFIRVFKKNINIPNVFKMKGSKKKKVKNKKEDKKSKKDLKKLNFAEKKNLALKIYCKVKPKILKLLKYIMKKFKIRNIDLNILEGTGDAASTATTYGAIWSVVGFFNTFSNQFLNTTVKDVKVNCDFNNKTFKLYLSSIFKISIVNIISIVLRIVIIYFLSKKIIKKEITGGERNE